MPRSVERRPTRPVARSEEDLSLLELVNRTIDRGVVLHGELILSVADVDLVSLRLDLCLSAIEPEEPDPADDE